MAHHFLLTHDHFAYFGFNRGGSVAKFLDGKFFGH
jgi:hypothetical protein